MLCTLAKRYLVTGGSGFVGGRVINALLSKGYDIISFDNRPSNIKGIEEVIGDITDPSTIRLDGHIDGVIHCAGILESSHPTSDLLMKVNFEGTMNIYANTLDQGSKKFVFMSSIMALGPYGSERFPMKEDHDPCPDEPYGRSKLLSERFLLKRAQDDDTVASIIRPPVIFGEGMSRNSSAMRTFLSIKKGFMPMIDRGRHIFNMLYVGNLSHALILALEKNEISNIFHVNEGPYTLRFAVDSISRRIGVKKGYVSIPKSAFYLLCRTSEIFGTLINGPPPLSMNKYRALTSDIWHMDHSRICDKLGYSPLFSFEEGIDRTCRWLDW
ncbi:MAG: NAD(P)-dependent oxidoreductase [Candidatus Thermoplasmatota archaeon]|nr:NAD(P)-dependent oxidoreductase [Candidatus Thermoplasmatota archaeon]